MRRARDDGLALAVVSSSAKKCKRLSNWLRLNRGVRFTNAKNIAKAITNNNGEGELLLDAKRVVIEKIEKIEGRDEGRGGDGDAEAEAVDASAHAATAMAVGKKPPQISIKIVKITNNLLLRELLIMSKSEKSLVRKKCSRAQGERDGKRGRSGARQRNRRSRERETGSIAESVVVRTRRRNPGKKALGWRRSVRRKKGPQRTDWRPERRGRARSGRTGRETAAGTSARTTSRAPPAQ